MWCDCLLKRGIDAIDKIDVMQCNRWSESFRSIVTGDASTDVVAAIDRKLCCWCCYRSGIMTSMTNWSIVRCCCCCNQQCLLIELLSSIAYADSLAFLAADQPTAVVSDIVDLELRRFRTMKDHRCCWLMLLLISSLLSVGKAKRIWVPPLLRTASMRRLH